MITFVFKCNIVNNNSTEKVTRDCLVCISYRNLCLLPNCVCCHIRVCIASYWHSTGPAVATCQQRKILRRARARSDTGRCHGGALVLPFSNQIVTGLSYVSPTDTCSYSYAENLKKIRVWCLCLFWLSSPPLLCKLSVVSGPNTFVTLSPGTLRALTRGYHSLEGTRGSVDMLRRYIVFPTSQFKCLTLFFGCLRIQEVWFE